MTQQDDITQPVLTDDEIEALAKKHICPHHARLEAVLPNRSPYQKTEQFRRVKALVGDVLSKLRAEGVPVADGGLTHRCANCSAVFQGAGCPSCRLAAPVASAPADERAARSAIASLADEIFPCLDIIDKREGAASGATEKIHDLANAIKRAALASAPVDPEAEEVDFLVRVLQTLETWRAEEWNELIERRPAILALLRPLVLASAPVAKLSAVSEDFAQEVWAAAQSPHGEPVEKSVARVASLLAEASAPVAGEAHPTDDELKRFARSMPARPWGIGSRQCDALAFARALLSRYAAPQASEAVRNQALEEAARVASQNGHYGNLLASSIR
ncbi:hypothetical protein, partial [Achromobacter deleyi]|uniref:hypothetical protein n=1 Tax=Achromobacter deleyi TaxID=1353891 RepID=UPI001583D997